MSQTIQQTALENFITYCKTVDISPEELQNPNVLFQTAQSKALTSEMDKDKKFAEEALVTIAKEFKTMPPYRACVSSFLIGLYGERGVSSLYADRDLLDFFDITIKFVVTFINRMHKLSGKSQLTPEAIRSFFKQLDMKKMIDLDPSLFEVMQGLPQICTAVLSRISTSRAMRSYLRGNQTLPVYARW